MRLTVSQTGSHPKTGPLHHGEMAEWLKALPC